MSTWKLLELKNQWDTLNQSLGGLGDSIALSGTNIPDVFPSSSDKEFRRLASSVKSLRADIVDLGLTLSEQSDHVMRDISHFYSLAKDYESEVDLYRKGREQAFKLYDNLAGEHKRLLVEFEELKADHKDNSKSLDAERVSRAELEQELVLSKSCHSSVISELSELKIELEGYKKKSELLQIENDQYAQNHQAGTEDRTSLMEQLAKEIKTRQDATVLAEAARNELSRLLGEAQEDRRLKQLAESEREQALGSVGQLQELIEQLKNEVLECEKMYKHEVTMRHKVEESLLATEDKLKETLGDWEQLAAAHKELGDQVESLSAERDHAVEEKETLLSQIATIATQLASEKQSGDKMLALIESTKKESADAVESAKDATEKYKQLERVIGEMVTEKAELENQLGAARKENALILEDHKDVLAIRNRAVELEQQLGEMKAMFESEKKLKSESNLEREKMAKSLEKSMSELNSIKNEMGKITSDRDGMISSLDSLQRVLQSERQEKGRLESAFQEVSGRLHSESKLKEEVLKSLEAETRSKAEIIAKLDEFKKMEPAMEKMKAEVEGFKDKIKDLEKEKKELVKSADETRKENSKVLSDLEKIKAQKEESDRKLAAQVEVGKEHSSGWAAEKKEHEKTYKAWSDEKARADKLQAESDAVKAAAKVAESAAQAEKSEHAKTYKAYESEKDLRAKVEAETERIRSEFAEMKGQLASLQAEKVAGEKRIQQFEERIGKLSQEKAEATQSAANAVQVKKLLEKEVSLRSEIESKLNLEKQLRVDCEASLASIRSEIDSYRIKLNNAEMTNKQLINRAEKLQSELSSLQRVNRELLDAVKDSDRDSGTTGQLI